MKSPDSNSLGFNHELNPTLIEKMKDIGGSAREEFQGTNPYGKLILSALGVMTAYEWGPGNETLTPYIGGQAVDASDGIKGIAITAGITGGFTVAQQLASSWLTRKSVQQFPTVSDKIFSYTNTDPDDEELRFKQFDELPRIKKLLYPFTIGTSFVVGREAFVTGSTNEKEKELKSVGRRSALIVGGTVAVLAGTLDVADQIIPNGTATQGILNVFKTPYPYVAAIVGVMGRDYLKSRKNKKLK